MDDDASPPRVRDGALRRIIEAAADPDSEEPAGPAAKGEGVLRRALEEACEAAGCNLADLTVQSVAVDPFRLDTKRGHANGRWFAEHIDRAIGPERRLHLRALHYSVLSLDVRKPDGKPYANTVKDWQWFQRASQAARWLGYIGFDRIVDANNTEPLLRRPDQTDGWMRHDREPKHSITIKLDTRHAIYPGMFEDDLVRIPVLEYAPPAPPVIAGPKGIDEIEPDIHITGFWRQFPYIFAIFGEKSGLRHVLEPLAARYGADLYTPSGEISDTQLHHMAKRAAEDGRTLIVSFLVINPRL